MVTMKRASVGPQSGDTTLFMSARRNAVSIAVTAALTGTMAMPVSVHAQDRGDEEIEEVVTYGKFRRSLVDAIGTKRDSQTIVEAISAEDIGKLPDSSSAESLSRLPGLAGERRNGRTSGISVRGFREDYVATTMNGRELLGIGDNRGVEYDLYPSEIISGVVVYKTPDASKTTQGIGGIVDLRTVRPLDTNPYIVVNASLEQNDLDSANPDFDDNGHRLSLSFSDVFADDTIGIALSVATTESPSQEQHFRGWGYPTEGNGDAILGGHDSFVRSAVLERDTVAGVLQYDPTDDLSITFDALYIDFSEEKAFRGVEEGGAQWGTGNYTVTESTSGLVTQGYFDDFRSVIRNDGERKVGELLTGAVNLEYNLDDNWTLELDASYGDVEKVITNIETYSGVGRSGLTTQGQPTGRSWTMGSTGAIYGPHPTIAPVDLSDFNTIRLAGPQAWGGGMQRVTQFQNAVASDGSVLQPDNAQDGFVNEPRFDEELLSVQFNAGRALEGSFFTGVDFGVQYKERTKSKDNGGFFLTAPTFPDDAPIPQEFRLGSADLSFLGIGSVVAYDGLSMYDNGFYIATDAANLQTDREGDSYTIKEEVTTLFAKADFDTVWGDVPVTGNIGIQYVQTDQTSFGKDAFINPNGFVTATSTSDGDDYSNVLPSLNVNFEIMDGHYIRFAASKTISRARIDDLKVNNRVTFEFNELRVREDTDPLNSPWTGAAGNARLRPLEATQFDLAYDWYYADDGFVSLAFFRKDLTNWHRDASFIADFSPFYIPGYHQVLVDDPNNPGTQIPLAPVLFLGKVDFTEDGLKGDVNGIELQGNLPFGQFSAALDGFGILAAAAFNDGDFDDGSSIPGLSEESYNLTLYYERGGFQARIAGTKRDKFSTEVRGLSLALIETVDQGAELIDAQISYDFGLDQWTNWLDGLTISLQGQNLTDEDTVQANSVDPRQITQYQTFGANYLLGFNYKFQ